MHDTACVDRIHQRFEREKVRGSPARNLGLAERFAVDVPEGERMGIDPECRRRHPFDAVEAPQHPPFTANEPASYRIPYPPGTRSEVLDDPGAPAKFDSNDAGVRPATIAQQGL